MADIFKNARLKIKRANEHIDALIERTTPLAPDLYKVTNGPGRTIAVLAKPDCFEIVYRPLESITDHLAPIIGDAVNNLRESLDLWINAVERSRGGRRRLYFPFSKKREDLETLKTYVAVKKALPDLARFISEEIQPCGDTNLHLWAATSLCNDNKHNDFLPIVTVTQINNINARTGGNTIQDCAVRGDANRRRRIIRSSTPIEIENNLTTTVEVTFREGAVFEYEPVIPTLTYMSQVVSETMNALCRFVEADS